ncbi:type II secretion system secretin GspD [Halioglobus sp. Uisw_031]|uniref:type II secretion system secretin GspD n=1 Tax=Halioglobus sp. Uisw_031 TaxID=3230977 RepID=UPI0039E7FF55
MKATTRFYPLTAIVLLLGLMLGSGSLQAQDYTINLKDTDIRELIQFVSDATGTTIVVDPVVKGKVRVISSKPVSANELYELFLSVLDVHGYTAVRSGDIVRVIPSKDARSAPLDVSDDRSSMTSDEYMTQVIRLENISAAKLIPVLRPLVPQQAHMAAYAPSNAIIISDVSANIDKIRDIIERMDKSAVQKTDIIKLRYAVAEDVVRMLDQLNKSAAKQTGGEQETLLVADARTNSVLVSGDELERARLRKLVNHLDTPLEQSGNVKVIYLQYSEAKDLAEVLTRVMKNISQLDTAEGAQAKSRSSNTATIEADEDTNALIITADADEMASLEAVIQRLDIRRAQVLVEAIIVEMQVTDGQELGLQWLFADNDGVFGSNITRNDARLGSIAGSQLSDDGGDTPDGVDLGGLAAALAGAGGVSLGWAQLDSMGLSMTVILNALNETANTNILSTPSILTLDNQEAYITVGEQVPFVTGSFTNTGAGGDGAQNPFQTIERENVGITLTVTPHINDGDSVVLDIMQEVSSISKTTVAASDVITNERKIQTKVLALDGQVIVLGGLIKDEVQDAQQKVPLLGDIPYLGRLFRSDAEVVRKSNLMVFIRTTIIRDDKQLVGASAEKYRYIRDQQALRKEKGLLYLGDANLPVLSEWEAQMQQLDAIKASANAPGAPASPVDGR